MKFFFVSEDSFYKIFKTLEKIPRGKSVEINIDPSHPIFNNEWRGKQIKDILDKKSINAIFITDTEKCRKFFEKIGLKTNHIEKNKLIKALKMIYLFLFDIKKFHLDTLKSKKTYSLFLVFGFEVLFTLGIIYMIYSLIRPNAKITINPSQTTETIIYNFRYYPAIDTEYPRYSRFITIPYYTGSFDYKYDLAINTQNIKYLQNPSVGEIKIFNKTEQEYTFVPNTKFITDDGKLFQTTIYVNVPAGYQGVPGEKIIRIKSMEQDNNGIMMGNRGNIPKGTTLYIKNLKQSLFLKDVYAVALEDFKGGTLDSQGEITAQDIDILSEKLKNYIEQQKKNIAIQNFSINDAMLMPFSDTINYNIKNIDIPHKTGEITSMINGTITADVSFIYIKWSDIISAFSQFIQQRPSEKSQLINIDKNSLTFYEDGIISQKDSTFVVPTKIEVIQGYNFEKDINGILEKIKSHIIGREKEDARSYILEFPEISSTKIKIKPYWYNSIPKLKSRIKINTNSSAN